MAQYKWIHPKPLARPNASVQGSILLPGSDVEKNYIREGDVFEPTAAELKAFGDKIERIKEGDNE